MGLNQRLLTHIDHLLKTRPALRSDVRTWIPNKFQIQVEVCPIITSNSIILDCSPSLEIGTRSKYFDNVWSSISKNSWIIKAEHRHRVRLLVSNSTEMSFMIWSRISKPSTKGNHWQRFITSLFVTRREKKGIERFSTKHRFETLKSMCEI